MKHFNHYFSQRMIREVGDALGEDMRPVSLQQNSLNWKLSINGTVQYLNEDPDCCVAFLEGVKWATENLEEIASSQIRMERAMEKHMEQLQAASPTI